MHDFRNQPSPTQTPSVEEPSKSLRFCKHCGSYNSEPGQCVNCYKSLGSIPVAIFAGLIATIGYGIFWVTLMCLTKFQLPIVAAVYGAVVSFAVSHFSRGRGVIFQIIASLLTILGMIFFDTLGLYLLLDIEGIQSIFEIKAEDWIYNFKYAILFDGATTLFAVLSLLGGFWVWRQGNPYED